MSDQSSETGAESDSPSSSPKAEVDDSPLQKCMDRNKQSLKVKLMMRRPYTQLVDQGIMPPLKTPASFHEQRQKLQRAKMGDLLKHKIQHRPDRTELIRQHILEADTGKIDPSLAERQRMLKRARLADSLNDQLSHRPGPLELIQKNILHTDENVERAVKEGQIAFKATCEGAAARPTHPFRYVTPEGDDSSSEGNAGGLSPSQDGSLDGSSVGATAGATVSCNGVGGSPLTVISSLSPLSSVPSPGTAQQTAEQINAKNATPPAPPTLPTTLILPVASAPVPTALSTLILKSQTESAPVVTNRNRKKSKAKCQPKPRTIKFHEYKGPPNAQKQQQTSSSNVETSYELLLQQQQLFLQWQLEWQHKYPQIILPASQKPPNTTTATSASDSTGNTKQVAANLASFLAVAAPGVLTTVPIGTSTTATTSGSNLTTTTPSQSVASDVTRTAAKLEEMKVSDLKAELKKRNLPVSGSKPQLLERLRPFSNEDGTLSDRPVSRRGSHGQIQQTVQDEGPLPSSPAPPSSTSRRVSCSSLDGSISSFRGGSDVLLSSLSPASSALSMSPGPASVRPSSVINMDIDMELCDSAPTPVIAEETIKMEPPPTPPPLPSIILPHGPLKQEQEINDLVRGLQEEQKALLEQQQLLRQQATEEATSTNDPKAQQRLLLQQHLQLKIQQQQIQQQLQLLQQQQQQPDTTSSMASPSKPANRTHSRQVKTANKQPQHQISEFYWGDEE
nr:EOG090X04KW [Cyclestheria hislopi]